MIKDYAHRATGQKKPKRKRALLTMLIILLAIAVPTMMYYIRFQKTLPKKEQAPTTEINLPKPAKTTLEKIKTKAKANQNNTQFDFYTILPNQSNSDK